MAEPGPGTGPGSGPRRSQRHSRSEPYIRVSRNIYRDPPERAGAQIWCFRQLPDAPRRSEWVPAGYQDIRGIYIPAKGDPYRPAQMGAPKWTSQEHLYSAPGSDMGTCWEPVLSGIYGEHTCFLMVIRADPLRQVLRMGRPRSTCSAAPGQTAISAVQLYIRLYSCTVHWARYIQLYSRIYSCCTVAVQPYIQLYSRCTATVHWAR